MALNDLTDRVERLAPFEERAGVRLEAVSAYQRTDDREKDYVYIGAELHPREGMTLARQIEVVAALYDDRGRVVGQASTKITPARFYGFKPFKISTSCGKLTIGKIRVFPK